MSRIVYVNGRYVPATQAAVSVNDRAVTFGDGVYEVCEVNAGALIEETRHLDRLGRSLESVRIGWPIGREALRGVLREIVRRNRVRDGLVYLQVSRGAARRDHGFPPDGVRPGLVVSARALDPAMNAARAAAGVAVVTVPETRWAHPHVKTLQLLPNVLAKQAARDAGAFEAWFVDRDGFVTEGASTNAWIVTPEGTLVTRQADEFNSPRSDAGSADRRRRRAWPPARRTAVFAGRGEDCARGLLFQRHDARHARRVARRDADRRRTAWPGRPRAAQSVQGARRKVVKASITMVYRPICRRLPICDMVPHAKRVTKRRAWGFNNNARAWARQYGKQSCRQRRRKTSRTRFSIMSASRKLP